MEAFWARVRRGGDTACWDWTGARNSSGYGYVMFGGIGYTAHALAFRLANMQVGAGHLRVRHDCGHRLCCNPTHLTATVPLSRAVVPA